MHNTLRMYRLNVYVKKLVKRLNAMLRAEIY